MLALASFAVGAVASVATPTVQPSTHGETVGGSDGSKAGASAPDLALGASDAVTDTGIEENAPRPA